VRAASCLRVRVRLGCAVLFECVECGELCGAWFSIEGCVGLSIHPHSALDLCVDWSGRGVEGEQRQRAGQASLGSKSSRSNLLTARNISATLALALTRQFPSPLSVCFLIGSCRDSILSGTPRRWFRTRLPETVSPNKPTPWRPRRTTRIFDLPTPQRGLTTRPPPRRPRRPRQGSSTSAVS
jgi:hypothetical protein